MQTINIDIETLKKINKDTIRETIREERYNLSDALISEVDRSEMNEIIKKTLCNTERRVIYRYDWMGEERGCWLIN